jgi:hypothetical protein
VRNSGRGWGRQLVPDGSASPAGLRGLCRLARAHPLLIGRRPFPRRPGAVHGGAGPGRRAPRAAAGRRGLRRAGAGEEASRPASAAHAPRPIPWALSLCSRPKQGLASLPMPHPVPTPGRGCKVAGQTLACFGQTRPPTQTPQVYSLVVGAFRAHLSSALAELAQRWGAFVAAEGGRLAPLVESMPTRCAFALPFCCPAAVVPPTCHPLPHPFAATPPPRPAPTRRSLRRRSLSSGEGKKLPGGEITAAEVHQIAAARRLPPCMAVMYDRLSSEHHLKHYGLQQMSLFLKHVGLPLEQALLFWRSMFSPRWVWGGGGEAGWGGVFAGAQRGALRAEGMGAAFSGLLPSSSCPLATRLRPPNHRHPAPPLNPAPPTPANPIPQPRRPLLPPAPRLTSSIASTPTTSATTTPRRGSAPTGASGAASASSSGSPAPARARASATAAAPSRRWTRPSSGRCWRGCSAASGARRGGGASWPRGRGFGERWRG